MNWPARTYSTDGGEDVEPGVARVRPWLSGDSVPRIGHADMAAAESEPFAAHLAGEAGGHLATSQTRGLSARHAYQLPARTPLAALEDVAEEALSQRTQTPMRARLTPVGPGGLAIRRGSAHHEAVSRHTVEARGQRARGAAPQAPLPPLQPTGDLEQRLAPLRSISRELIARGMPATLVSELLAEIVAEFGSQVLESERNARLALVEQLLLRIPWTPFTTPALPLHGAYLVTGPAGSGKSVFIAHLALMAAEQGQDDVVFVNTDNSRIGAAAQMTALGTVFGYEVVHAYTPQDLRQLASRCNTASLLLIETAGWSPRSVDTPSRTRVQEPWRWRLPNAHVVVCVPATSHADDVQALLTTTGEKATRSVAVLCKVSETRNVLPALGALAQARQPVGMVVPGPNLTESVGPLDLADVTRSALGVVTPQPRKGRVTC